MNVSWIDSGQFKIVNRNGRRYVFRKNNSGNTEINIPRNIDISRGKGLVKAWLKRNPNKVRNPTSFKPKKKTPNRPALKLNISPFPNAVPFNCGTNFFKKVRNSNGKTGFQATKLANHNKLYTVPNGKMTVNKGMAQLGKGTQGIVFLAYTGPRANNPVTIKVVPKYPSNKRQVAEFEFYLQKKLYAIHPGNIVPKPYKMIKCKDFIPVSSWKNANKKPGYDYSDQTVIFSEYMDGGSLSDWLNKMSGRLDERFIQNLIRRILEMLFLISKRIPAFRHNDLHLDNILVRENRPPITTRSARFYMNDFGWAYTGKGTNPMVDSGKYESSFGIGPKTSSRYDMHLFLNELHKWLQRNGGKAKYPKAMGFIEKYLPEGYRGSSTKYINESRLRYGMEHKSLPKLVDIVKDKYVVTASNGNSPAYNRSPKYAPNSPVYKVNSNMKYLYNTAYKSPKTFQRGIKPRSKSKTKAKKRPSSQKKSKSGSSAKPRRLSFSSVKKNKSTNSNMSFSPVKPRRLSFSPKKMNWAKVSPRTFLKLTPRRRALVAAARGGKKNNKPRGMLVKNVALTRGAPVVRETFRMATIVPKFMKVPNVAGGARQHTKVAPNLPKAKSASANNKITQNMLKSKKFNALRVKLTSPGNGNNYYNRWNAARLKAIKHVENRLKRGWPPFSPSPVRRPSPPRAAPAPAPRNRSPPNARLAAILQRSKLNNRRKKYRVAFTPKTGRMKVEGNKGRLSYVNGAGVSLDYLKRIAAEYKVNITGLRSKVAIANKIFRNNK